MLSWGDQALRLLIDEQSFTESARRLGMAIADESQSVDVIAELETLSEHAACCGCKN